MRILELPSIKGHNLKNSGIRSVYTPTQIAAMERTAESAKKINPKKVAVRSKTRKYSFVISDEV